MAALASADDNETEGSKAERKQMAFLLIPILIYFWYLFIPPNRCPFRRPRLSWADKQNIIQNSALLLETKKIENFEIPEFVEPEKFIMLKTDLDTLKTRLYNETMDRNFRPTYSSMRAKWAVADDIQDVWDEN